MPPHRYPVFSLASFMRFLGLEMRDTHQTALRERRIFFIDNSMTILASLNLLAWLTEIRDVLSARRCPRRTTQLRVFVCREFEAHQPSIRREEL